MLQLWGKTNFNWTNTCHDHLRNQQSLMRQIKTAKFISLKSVFRIVDIYAIYERFKPSSQDAAGLIEGIAAADHGLLQACCVLDSLLK
jgi:hypothetical protein